MIGARGFPLRWGSFLPLLLLSTAMLLGAFQRDGDIFVDLGPNDVGYVSGFREDFEVDEPTIIHWSGHRATITVPFRLGGPLEVTLRYKRHVRAPAQVRLFLGDELVRSLEVPQQDFELMTVTSTTRERRPFELRLLSDSDDRRPLGLAFDWISIRAAGMVLPDTSALLMMLSWVAAFYLVPLLLGFGPRFALGLGFLAALALTLLALVHKLWPVHSALTLGLRAHVLSAVVLAFFMVCSRREGSFLAGRAARWAMLLVYIGTVVRLFALFHPDFYYPDVRTHSKFVSVLWTEGVGGFFSDHIANQHRHLLGLQYVGDRWLAFPYPPLLYLGIYPFSLLRLPVDDWMKLIPTLLLTVEGLVVFVIARRLGIGQRAAGLATLLHATARVIAFRLAVASYAALFGHFWDTLAVLYLVTNWERFNRWTVASGFGLLVAVSLLSYAGSALVLGTFVPALSLYLWFRRPKLRTQAIWIAGTALAFALAAVGLFYIQYLPELLPGGLGSGSGVGAGGELIDLRLTPLPALSMAAHRLDLFYGPVFGLLIFVALYLFRRERSHPLAGPLAIASVASFLALNFLRAGLGATHIFQFTKDDLVILPLAVIVLGMGLDRLFSSSRAWRWAAPVLLGVWVGWGWIALSRDIRSRFIRPDYPPDASASTATRDERPASAGTTTPAKR